MHFTLDVLPKSRAFFKKVIETESLKTLNTVPVGFNNNIIWNIGHIVVTQQLLIYNLSGLPMMVSEDLINNYRKGTKPKGQVTQAQVDEIKALLNSTIEQMQADYKAGVFKTFQEYTVSTTGNTLTNIDEALQFTLFHEGLHTGYVMALIRAL